LVTGSALSIICTDSEENTQMAVDNRERLRSLTFDVEDLHDGRDTVNIDFAVP